MRGLTAAERHLLVVSRPGLPDYFFDDALAVDEWALVKRGLLRPYLLEGDDQVWFETTSLGVQALAWCSEHKGEGKP